MRPYAQSKLLLNIYSFELAKRLEGTGVTVNCVHPGAVNTHLGSDSAKNAVVRLLEKAVKFFMLSPKQGAATSVYAATSPALETTTGKYFVKSKPVSASKDCYDSSLAARVWLVCQGLTSSP